MIHSPVKLARSILSALLPGCSIILLDFSDDASNYIKAKPQALQEY